MTSTLYVVDAPNLPRAVRDVFGIVLFTYICDEIRCTTNFISVEFIIGEVKTRRREIGQWRDNAHRLIPCAGKDKLIDLSIYSLNIYVKCRARTGDSIQKNRKGTTARLKTNTKAKTKTQVVIHLYGS